MAGSLISKKFKIEVHRCITINETQGNSKFLFHSLSPVSTLDYTCAEFTEAERAMGQQLIQLSTQLSEARDSEAIRNITDSQQTSIIPQATGYLLEGLDFQKLILTEGKSIRKL